jgi:hypothetical protein
VAVSSVLLIASVVLAVVTTVTMLSIGEAQSGFSSVLGEEGLTLAEGCVEDVLQRVHDNAGFSATTITVPEGTCQVVYNLGGPASWDIEVRVLNTDYNRRVRVVFSRGSNIVITSWQEI